MKQDFLFRNFKVLRKGGGGNISSIAVHSEEVIKNSLFTALKGREDDGHRYLHKAAQKGAGALLVQDADSVPPDFKGTVVQAEDTAKALSLALNEFYDNPSRKLFMIGVTGTNGKTTISYLTEHILNRLGLPAGIIGTVERRFKGRVWPARLTTPDPVELFKRLKDFLDLQARAVVMEVSSIALSQKRTDGMDFNVGVFTNLTRDHLDYHPDFESYFSAKKRLFQKMEQSRESRFVSLINRDDSFGRRLLRELRGRRLTFGEGAGADFSFQIKFQDLSRTVFTIRSPDDFAEGEISLTGRHNIYNVTGAVSAAVTAGFALPDCLKALRDFPGVPGRLEKVTGSHQPFQVFVDYAHTPSALKQVLQSLNSFLKPPGRLVTVFGCGGDRDREKRGEMALTAGALCRRVILTSDNPRREDPKKIMEDCLKPLPPPVRRKFTLEKDRAKAIEQAVQEAKAGDFILIAGKGHERVQIIGDRRIPFDDREIAKSALPRRKNTPL